ncbi:glycosyltransferase family 2 protein [Roseitranquillus sediminis]|uniref:glycosyltransferase family 2 protein n=1 Tax=Roseitranquillus sediminis TaxID=2809051 RepID=UPI001D0CA9FF|nr:glycosyltransferase family A protein [Roseitranquillus sediminis]MBM9595168.1 glycosyltransferase family 2 protein [Roseitranquillus sediminis]
MISSEPPAATLAVLFYNHKAFVAETVRAALAQEGPPLQIILSDDASPDGTFRIVQEAAAGYDGPHRVICRRNAANLGLADHVNALMALAEADVVLLAGGDDLPLPDRAARSLALLGAHPEAMAVSFTDERIDAEGRPLPRPVPADPDGLTRVTLEDVLAGNGSFRSSGASRAIRRPVWERFGPLAPDCPTEDTTLALRALMLGEILVSHRPGIRYRVLPRSLSSAAGLQAMKLERIGAQYEADIARARQASILDEATAARAQAWARQTISARLLRQRLDAPGRIALSDLLRALRHPRLRRREKRRYLRRFLLRRPD